MGASKSAQPKGCGYKSLNLGHTEEKWVQVNQRNLKVAATNRSIWVILKKDGCK